VEVFSTILNDYPPWDSWSASGGSITILAAGAIDMDANRTSVAPIKEFEILLGSTRFMFVSLGIRCLLHPRPIEIAVIV
jgi:hypothetical protein